MEQTDKQAFVTALVRKHGLQLRRYLSARLSDAAADVPDLVQEVYLRLLRIPAHETIRSPQAYLFTVAHHVLHQHRLSRVATPESLDIVDVMAELPTLVEADPSMALDIRQRLESLDRVLQELSPKARAAFILHRRYGFSVEEVAGHLNVSHSMVKKYLAKAIAHSKQRIDELSRDAL